MCWRLCPLGTLPRGAGVGVASSQIHTAQPAHTRVAWFEWRGLTRPRVPTYAGGEIPPTPGRCTYLPSRRPSQAISDAPAEPLYLCT